MDGDSKFQSTPPRRRRRSSCCRYLFSAQNFNPRLREGGDFAQNIIGCFHFNFNPRLREGGDERQRKGWRIFWISIHASAKEATCSDWFSNLLTHDFNPRLREGGDEDYQVLRKQSWNFNPRLREGGDVCCRLCGCGTRISIHASAKEATCDSNRNTCGRRHFNPRLREGGDRNIL